MVAVRVGMSPLAHFPFDSELPWSIVVGDHDPAHTKFLFAVVVPPNYSRELRRHRRRLRECANAGHSLSLLSVDFPTLPSPSTRVLPKYACQIQHVVEDEQHHQDQIAAQR